MNSILITGASRGIGFEVTKMFLEKGWEVHALSKTESHLKQYLSEFSVNVHAVDVAVKESVFKSAESIKTPLQVLVLNAGVCTQANLNDENADDVWQHTMDVNVNGVWNCLRAYVPLMADGGKIVIVSSGLGKLGRAGYTAYGASKHAVLGMVKCLSKELAPRQITVNAVCPGWVDTEMAKRDVVNTAKVLCKTVEQVREEAEANIPLKRFVSPKEVALLIKWLSSDEACAITGQSYNISGGEFTV